MESVQSSNPGPRSRLLIFPAYSALHQIVLVPHRLVNRFTRIGGSDVHPPSPLICTRGGLPKDHPGFGLLISDTTNKVFYD
jgi:hypothetical protein